MSQLAGFTKKSDLPYFLSAICDIEYTHEPLLAPNDQILDDYRKHRIAWEEYEERFLALMRERKIESTLPLDLFARPTVLLCSETTPEQCHRRLVVEYLQRHGAGLTVTHL